MGIPVYQNECFWIQAPPLTPCSALKYTFPPIAEIHSLAKHEFFRPQWTEFNFLNYQLTSYTKLRALQTREFNKQTSWFWDKLWHHDRSSKSSHKQTSLHVLCLEAICRQPSFKTNFSPLTSKEKYFEHLPRFVLYAEIMKSFNWHVQCSNTTWDYKVMFSVDGACVLRHC